MQSMLPFDPSATLAEKTPRLFLQESAPIESREPFGCLFKEEITRCGFASGKKTKTRTHDDPHETSNDGSMRLDWLEDEEDDEAAESEEEK